VIVRQDTQVTAVHEMIVELIVTDVKIALEIRNRKCVQIK